MKKFFTRTISTIFIIIAAISLIGTSITAIPPSTTYTDSISISIPIDHYIHESQDAHDEFTITNFGRIPEPGAPNLPSKIFSVALPAKATVTQVTFDYKTPQILEETYIIEPNPLPRVIGKENPEIYQVQQKQYQQTIDTIYTQDTHYPQNIAEYIGTASYREFKLIEFRITPISYNPTTHQIKYYSDITANIEYSVPSIDAVYTPTTAQAHSRIQDLILNYDQASTWYPETTTRGNDFVIITLDSLTNSINSIKNWEQAKGKNVHVVTTTTINSQYSGYDLQEKMRNFLMDKYPASEWGIHEVLLIGDYDDVPMRRTAQNIGYGKPETDYYYAELSLPDSQSWDIDGDHNYGENSDPIDFYSEVAVGRIPWSDPATVQHICEKSVSYEQNNDPSFKKNILLLGAFFWPDTDNAVLMEAKVDQPWMTDWTMTRMYEDPQSNYPMDYNLGYNNVLNDWSTNTYAFVNWAGHGSPTGCYEYYPSQAFIDNTACNSLNDDYPAIIFADACSNSDTDDLNIGKAMLKQGGVGFLGATKVALGQPGWNDPGDGSSQSLDYLFTTYVTSTDYSQGDAHQKALTDMYTNGLWSYNKYETFEWGALWGNPGLGMGVMTQNNKPETPTPPEGPAQVIVGTPHNFSAIGFDPDDDEILFKWDWGDGLGTTWEGPYPSGTTITANNTWFKGGTYQIRVKIKDVLGSISDWSDPLTISVAHPVMSITTPTSGMGPLEFDISNIGEVYANDIHWTLTIRGGFLSLISHQEQGTISGLDVSETETVICSESFFGLGPLTLIIDAKATYSAPVSKQISGFIIGPYILLT